MAVKGAIIRLLTEASGGCTVLGMLKLSQLTALFPTEEACQEFLTKHRWPNGVTCPRCGNAKVYALKKRPFHWQCHGCAQKGYRFSLITKTIFENTKYPLRTWFTVAFFMLHSKKGMSALQIKRMVFHDKASYETVWYMCQRIRAAMDNDEFRELMGIVEVDETYIGGKNKNRHGGGRGMMQRTGKRTISRDDKMPVIGAISRKGSVVARAMAHVTGKNMRAFIKEVVSDKVSLVATDDHVGYRLLESEGVPHETVNHSEGEYVRGNVHTANLDSFWSMLKRGVVGTYHQVSWNYLPLYLAEFSFRHNHREDADMFGRLIAQC